MTYKADIHHRRSIRLKGYDYSSANAYFITVCVECRECLFGEIVDDAMRVNDAGRMIAEVWEGLPERFPHVTMNECIVMPNHFHGIICIDAVGADPCVCPNFPETAEFPPFPASCVFPKSSDQITDKGAHAGAPLPRIVQWFKTMTTNAYIREVKSYGWPHFQGRLWQRNYYERIIRDEIELAAIRDYIRFNLVQWDEDEEKPAHST